MLPIIKETRFDFHSFIDELSQKETIFLLYLANCENSDEIREIMHNYERPDDFLKTASKQDKKTLNNLPMEEIRKMLLEIYEETDPSLFYNMLLSDKKQSLFKISPLMYAIYTFLAVVYKQKFKMAQKNYEQYLYHFNIESEWIEEVNTFVEKRFLYSNRPHLNILGLLMFMSITEDYIQNEMDELDNELMLQGRIGVLTYHISLQNSYIDQKKLTDLHLQNSKLEQQHTRTQQNLEKKKQQFDKLNEQNKGLLQEIKLSKKQNSKSSKDTDAQPITDTDLYQNMYQDLRKKDEEITAYRIKLDEAKQTPHPIYESMIAKLTEQIASIKEDAKMKKIQMKQLQNKVKNYEEETVPSFMERYLATNEMSKDVFQSLQNLVSEYEETFVTAKPLPSLSYQPTQPYQPSESAKETDNHIGYAVLENGKHYVVLADKTKLLLTGIPQYIYIGNYQFVWVTNGGEFKWLFNSLYAPQEYDDTQLAFLSVSERAGELVFLDGNAESCPVHQLPSMHHMKPNQVIAVRENGDFHRFYTTAFVNADTHLDAIKAKGQEAYYVLDVQSDGCFLRNLETGEETFKWLNTDVPFDTYQIVCLEGSSVKHVFQHAQFYTLSSYYNRSEYGTVYQENNTWMVKKLSGETAMLHNLPYQAEFEDGETITVDEHNHFLRRLKTEHTIKETIESKKISSVALTRQEKTKKIGSDVSNKRVLIIGKITYEDSYRNALRKRGYIAEMVDGYLSWSRVKAKTKNQDMIIVVPNFISHENMWKLKELEINIPIIYAESDGANQIAQKLEA